jgi:uncharacterized protein (TIGR02996 family)
MNDDSGFLAAIQENLDDDTTRLIYADWLEERGDVRGEYLRLVHQVAQNPSRLEELRRQIDPAWLAAVSTRRSRRKGLFSWAKDPVINIANEDSLSSHTEKRRFILMMLLCAVRCRATELRFEPSETDQPWCVRYKACDQWYDMVPFPFHFTVSHDFRHLAGISSSSLWQRLFSWRRDNGTPNQTSIRLVISGKSVELIASFCPSISRSPTAETVAIWFPQAGNAVEETGSILHEHFRKHPVE